MKQFTIRTLIPGTLNYTDEYETVVSIGAVEMTTSQADAKAIDSLVIEEIHVDGEARLWQRIEDAHEDLS